MADVTVVGLGDIGAKLDKMFKETAKIAIRKGARAGGNVFRKEVRAKAPVLKDKKDKRNTPGYLKNHIRRWEKVNGDGSISEFIGPDKNAFYGLFVDQGHRNRRTKYEQRMERAGLAKRRALISAEFGGKDTPAHPFMRPAFDGKKDEAVRVTGEVLMQEIQKEIK